MIFKSEYDNKRVAYTHMYIQILHYISKTSTMYISSCGHIHTYVHVYIYTYIYWGRYYQCFFEDINEERFLKNENTSTNVTQKNNMEDFFKKESTLENEQHSIP